LVPKCLEMAGLSVSLVITREEEGVTATFLIDLNDRELASFILYEPDTFFCQDYIDFVEKKRGELTFDDSNGSVEMSHMADGKGDLILCEVSKMEGGGEIKLMIPAELMTEPLMRLSREFACGPGY
jgi:hypothetical protein